MKRRARQADLIEVPLADAASVNLFFALDTQWHRQGMSGQRLGINYAAVPPTAQAYEIAMTPNIMADLQLMEAAALAEFASREARR